jgi:replicative DNA helicase
MDSSGVSPGTTVLCGFERLDACGGVLHRGQVTVLAGAPAIGKSALSIGMMLGACAGERDAAAYFTSFYENGDLLLRLMARASGLAPARSSQRRHGIAAFAEQAQRRGLHLLQGGGLVRQSEVVSEKAREVIRRSPNLCALAIDPLLTSTPSMRDGAKERRETLLGLRGLARELNLAVLLVSALPRTLLEADDMRPSPQHLRSVGLDLETADTTMLLHRPALFSPRAPQELAEVAIYHRGEEEPRLASLRYFEDSCCFDG